MNRTTRTGLAVTALILGPAQLAHAAWLIEPSAQVSTSYEDNIRLSPNNKEDGIVSNITGQAELRNVTERSEVAAVLGANYRMYDQVEDTNDTLDDQDSEFLLLNALRRNERTALGIEASYRRDDLLRRVLVLDEPLGGDPIGGDPTDPGIDDPIGGDPGEEANEDPDVDIAAERDQVRRERITVAPSMNFAMTQRSNVNVGYTYYSLDYDEGDTLPNSGIQDSESHTVMADFNRVMSERTTLGVGVRATRFEPDISLETDIYEATLNFDRQISERDLLSVRIGVRETDSDAGSETGGVLNLRYSHRTATGQLYGSIERSLYPNAYGEIVETDRLSLGLRQSLSDRWSWSLRTQAFSTTSETANSGRNRDYFSIRPEIRWAISPAWSVGASYGYQWVDRENDTDEASGSAVGLSLNYQPPRRI